MALVAAQAEEQRFGDVLLRAHLPLGWKVKRYVKNHHFIEIEDAQGNVHRFEAKSLVQGSCSDCGQVLYVESRIGDMRCAHCGGEVDWVWGTSKISFIPESGARFRSSSAPGEDI